MEHSAWRMEMMTAKISEIFLSYQGEGPFAGSRQLFIRFYGCNRSCVFCDTVLESYKSFTQNGLMGKILSFEDNYNELVLTGGEPLLFADFLQSFLELFRTCGRRPVYLETNGTLPEELRKVIDYVDIIAMDFKLPSSTGDEGDIWKTHEEFAKEAVRKELIVKAVITDKTTIDDVKHMAHVVGRLRREPEVVLQPVTPVNEMAKKPDGEMLVFFKKYLEKNIKKEVLVLGQLHKCLGIS